MHQALYRKWRPKTFDDVIGQEHIITTLKNEIKSNSFSHAYLFTGSRGTGKTTCSKILAKAVNCLNPINGNPCLKCEACEKIENEATIDVFEIDAASNNGVDNIRQLREEANYAPSFCKYRVYIIDETHMLSIGAFNALLKIMEEPPQHVVFILATTEVHKVPATILSRCQRFDFKRVGINCLSQRLQIIAEKENFSIDDNASKMIAKLSDGGVRDAISLLDQCSSNSININEEVVCQTALIAGKEYLFSLCQCVIDKNSAAAIQIINKLYIDSKNLERLATELIELFRDIMILKTVDLNKDITEDDLINLMPDELEKAKQLAGNFTLSGVLKNITLLQECLTRQNTAINKKIELEMCFIKLCNQKMDTSNEGLLKRLEDLESRIINGEYNVNPIKNESTSMKKIEQVDNDVKNNNPESEKPDLSSEFENTNDNFDDWPEVCQELKTTDQPLYGLLSGAEIFYIQDIIYLKPSSAILEKIFSQAEHKQKLYDAIKKVTGKNIAVKIAEQKKTDNKQENPLNRMLKKAENAGVFIEGHLK